MQAWNFPYLYNIPTYFADIDGISHSFKHKLHDKQGVKVIWGQGHSRLQNKNITYFKSKKTHSLIKTAHFYEHLQL